MWIRLWTTQHKIKKINHYFLVKDSDIVLLSILRYIETQKYFVITKDAFKSKIVFKHVTLNYVNHFYNMVL